MGDGCGVLAQIQNDRTAATDPATPAYRAAHTMPACIAAEIAMRADAAG